MGRAGVLRIDLNRRDVKRKFRLSLGDKESRNAVDMDAGRGGERDLDPRGIFVAAKSVAMAADFKRE